eukprot:g6253.t1
MAPKTATDAGPSRPLSRHERRHGTKQRAVPEPTIQVPKGAIVVAVAIAVLAAILGVKTSLQAASNSKPFSMEGFEKKGKGGGSGGGDGPTIEPHERDTSEEDAPNGDWLTDPTMAKSMSTSKCDIDRVPYLNMSTKRFSREYEGVKPVIVEGFIDERWPARFRGRWARPSLLSSFPDAAVHVSSGAGVVHSGGESLRTLTLTAFLEELRENDGGGESATSFTFDMEFFDQNKELKDDYKVPSIFRSFNSHESMRRETSWSMLSLGASGAGLPFHSHGETWLGVAYGAKRWAIYPPTESRPYEAEKQSGWHPLMGSMEWFKEVAPLLKKTGESPPMECMQNAGDLIYVPANWKHMTLNIGESIGVGGQAVYGGEMRLQNGLYLLDQRPDDPELLHAVGVGLAHRGIASLEYEDKPDIEMDYEMAMNMIRAGQMLPAKQTINLASENLRKAKKDRPGYPETHIILAETLLKTGNNEEAEKVIEEAWKTFSRDELPDAVPDSTLVTVQLNLARFFLQSQEGDKAEAYLRKGALSIMPDHADGLADLAVAMALQGEGNPDKMTEALETLEKAEKSGASGNSFDKRREYVIRTFMKEQKKSEAAVAAAAAAEAANEQTEADAAEAAAAADE